MCFISMLDLSKEDVEAILENYKKRNKIEIYPEDEDDVLVITPDYDYKDKEVWYIN